MADELNQEVIVPTEQVTEPTSNPIEQRAMEQGWVPQDEWAGAPEDWRPAKEFVDRGELFRKIDEVKRENKNLRQGLDELGKHHARVRQMAYEQAVSDLKQQKKVALSEGDADAVVEIDEKLDEAREAHRAVKATPPQSVVPQNDPVLDQWITRNSWYANDRVMKAVADEVARATFERGIQDKQAILNAVDAGMRKEFPHKFVNPNREKATAVEGSSRATTKKDSVDMSDAEKAIMNKILKTGAITKEKYLSEFKATKGRGA